jgi:hypothetical protein
VLLPLCLTVVPRRHKRYRVVQALGPDGALDPGGRWPGFSRSSQLWSGGALDDEGHSFRHRRLEPFTSGRENFITWASSLLAAVTEPPQEVRCWFLCPTMGAALGVLTPVAGDYGSEAGR